MSHPGTPHSRDDRKRAIDSLIAMAKARDGDDISTYQRLLEEPTTQRDAMIACRRILPLLADQSGGPAGEPLHPDSVSRTFDRRTRKAGVAHIRFHDLRHSHCAHLIAAGRNPKEISRRLGHASVSFTLDRYGHLMPDAGAQAAAAVAALVVGSARRAVVPFAEAPCPRTPEGWERCEEPA